MDFKHFRFQLVARVLVLTALALLLSYLIVWTTFYVASTAVALLILFQIYALVRYAEKTTRDLSLFLQAVRQSDFSQRFTSQGRGPIFEQLSTAFTDVSEDFQRIRAEREHHFRYLQNVVQHIGIALISFRREGTVELVNTAAKRLLGVNRLDHLEDVAAFSPALAKTLRTLDNGEPALVKVERGSQVLQLIVRASQFRLGGEGYVLVSIQDIRNELEEKEMEAWQHLTQVLKHEIMNSVAPIASLAATVDHLLVRRPTRSAARRSESHFEDAREALQIITRRSEALMHFVDSYHSFTQIPTPDFKIFPIEDLFTPIQRLLQAQFEEQGVTFTLTIDPPTLKLTADPALIEQVLINLLLNALEALEDQADACVALGARVDGSGRPLIEVRDNGPGISPDVQEHIFVPFFTTKENGSGIGLSLSRQVMRLHGGTLSVASDPGRETTFTLRF